MLVYVALSRRRRAAFTRCCSWLRVLSVWEGATSEQSRQFLNVCLPLWCRSGSRLVSCPSSGMTEATVKVTRRPLSVVDAFVYLVR
jgi:hypothetical protein